MLSNSCLQARGGFRSPEVVTVDREILTIVQVADYLQVHPDKVYRLVRSGELPASKIGKEWRIQRQDLQHFLDERKAPAARSASAGVRSSRGRRRG